MTNLTVQLDPVALREATAQAIMGILTPEVRTALVQNAISAILKPSTDSWNRDKSPLQEAFNLAVQQCAREVAKEVVSADPSIVERLRALAKECAEKVLKQDTDKLAEKMADAFVSGIESEGRNRA
jgi:hypothetical protein